MVHPKLMSNFATLPINEFCSVLLDNSDDMIFVKDEQFRILYANKSFLNMYAPDIRAEIIGKTTIEKFSEEEAAIFLREDQKAFRNGRAELIEELTDYTGKARIYETRKIRFTDNQGRVLMLGICHDISKWAEREKKLAQTNLALESFAAVAAHDLRSPLGSFLSGIELIKLDKESVITEHSLRYLEMMKQSVEGLIGQIGSLLSTYKLSRSGKPQTEEVDTAILMEEVKFNLSRMIEEQDVHIRSTTLPVIRADKHLFRQLLHNLVENSIKYRSKENPVIILRYEKVKEEHLFSIEDNGVGVQKAHGDNIFKLFEQTHEASNGVGIGLSLCKKIVEMHGGAIWIDTFYKPGCKICFTLPV